MRNSQLCMHGNLIVLMFLTVAMSSSVTAQSISGTVTEAETGEAVIGANVVVAGTVRGAATNSYGFFVIPDLARATHTLRISAVGYRTDSVAVDLSEGKDVRLAIALSSVSIELGEVLVVAEKAPLESRTISQAEISMEQIYRLPSLGGEPDIFRALLMLPGVKSSNELSAGLNIRGGSPDQNLVLLDKMVMYNPYHLGGFISTFNSDAINHVKLIKGAMPAEYGGRLSSVIDVTMKEGGQDRLRGSGGVSMIDSRLTLDGPITDDISFMVSGRRIYLDAMVSLFSDEVLPYYFYDLLAKTNYKIDDDNRLFFSGFFGRDVLEPFDEDDDGQVDWGNTAFNLRWTHVLGSKLFSNISLVYSEYSFNMEETQYSYDENYNRVPEDLFKSVSGIDDITLRGELEYFHSSEHAFKGGMELYLHAFTSEATDQIEEFIELVGDLPRQRSTQMSLFVQDEWNVSDVFTTNIGGRLFYFDRGNYLRAEPRLSAMYTFDDGTVGKAAVMGANQFLHLVSRSDLSLPIDMWFPSTDRLPPSYSWQYTLGMSRPMWENYMLTVEGYYKKMDRILEFKENAVFSFFIPLESELTSGNGTAYGLEFMFQRKAGALTGWLSYTLSWAELEFPELNYGKPYPPRHDRRHDIALVLNYRLGENWEFTAAWVYSTGQAITFPVAQYAIDDYYSTDFLYTEKNGYRMPSYHRLDLNFAYAFKWFDWDWKFSINIYNTYNNMNPFIYYVERDYSSSWENPRNVIKQGTLLPFVPTLGLSFRF